MQHARESAVRTIALAATICGRAPAAGATLNVPGDYPTIQSAIDVSNHGDVVLVADGIYTGSGNWDLDFGGRLMTVRSANGPFNCIIDCQAGPYEWHRGFHFHSGETAAAVVDGLTVRGAHIGFYLGGPVAGGGIRCDGASPTIANCIIAGNVVESNYSALGAGIYSAGGSPTLLNCTIADNHAPGNDGYASGGGIYATGTITIINCAIVGNGAGAVFAATYGGGASVGAGSTLVNCTFSGNGAHVGAGLSGGGTVINCTFSENTLFQYSSPGTGGGGYFGSGQLTNCIFRGNGWQHGPYAGLLNQIMGAPTVSHSNVQGGWAGAGANNIDADPLFVDAHGPDGEVGTPDDDLRLRSLSPCIDAGNTAALPPDVTTDLDGSPRRVDDHFALDCAQAPGQCGKAPVVDMGAYEFHFNCPWDLDFSGAVGAEDFTALLAAWGTATTGPPDFDNDGSVGTTDFLALLGHWGPCCAVSEATQPDCNANAVVDECDVAAGTSSDCDFNTVPDECEFVDCNRNGIADQCDVAAGTSHDCDADGVLDECHGCHGCINEVAGLVATDAATDDSFGEAVSVSGDVAVVGAPGTGPNMGAAHVYRRNGTRWVHEAVLTASDGATADAFGSSVAVSGSVALVGARHVDASRGSAYVFRFNGTQWVEEAKLTASDGASLDSFGFCVALGSVAVVGAYQDDSARGSAYVFRFNGTQWVQEQKLTAADGLAGDRFGFAVAVSGGLVLAGAPNDVPAGSAYVFGFNGVQWVQEQKVIGSGASLFDDFGCAVAVRGDVALIGDRLDGDTGSAYGRVGRGRVRPLRRVGLDC